MNTKNTNKAAETVAALKRHEIAAAEIVVSRATVARWSNYIGGEDVETVREFKPGEVVTLRDWRPEGMMAATEDGREMFLFWHYLEAMTKAPAEIDPGEVREAFDAHTERGEGERFDVIEKAASLATVRGDVAEFDSADEYETTARAFLTMTGATFSARYLGAFDSLTEWGEEDSGSKSVRGLIPVWRVSIRSASGKMSVRFRGSINNGREGLTDCRVYSVLSCLTKSEPGTFDEFAQEFGYFPISSAAQYRHARRVFAGCCREFRGVCRVWPDDGDRSRLAYIN